MTTSIPNGIVGLVGREPIGCALTIGTKGPSGAPVEKDRFHILSPDAASAEYSKSGGGTYTAPKRDPHPAFAAFNGAPADKRKSIPIRLAHATIDELFEVRRQCKSGAPGIAKHPKQAPVCRGNGITAIRYMGEGKELAKIECPGDKCPFSMPPPEVNGRAQKPFCGPFMRFLGRFDFPASADGRRLPSITFKFTSGGWGSAANFLGFFDSFRRACDGFGVDPNSVPLFGMPAILLLTEKTNPATKSRFPVVSIQFSGEADIIGWITSQLKNRAAIAAMTQPSLALADLSSDADIAADVALINPAQVPAP